MLLRSLAGPATIGVVLSIALVARLTLGRAGGRRVRGWSLALAGSGFAAFLAWQAFVLIAPKGGNSDLKVFYRAGGEIASGGDPYQFGGEMVFLNPLPALGAFRLVARLPYPVVAAAWSLLNAAMTLALVPLANRLLASEDDPDSGGAPPPLPPDVSALLASALLNSNAALRGHRWGQLCALTAFALFLALWARQRGRPWLAGACLAVAAFKPATALPFLLLFLRRRDWPTWLALIGVSLGLALVAAPPTRWAALLGHNLAQIGDSSRPGKINDYDFPRDISADLVSFNQLYHRAGLRDRGLISKLHMLSVAAVLAGLLMIRNREPFAAVASTVAAGSMLVLYHRTYDGVILALPLAYASSTALTSTTDRRRATAVIAAALMLAAIDLPREAFIDLTRWSLAQGMLGRFVQAVILPYATWSILLATLLLGASLAPRKRGAGGSRAPHLRRANGAPE